MALGYLPLLTKGPLALFYGGEIISPELSTESAGSHFSLFYMASFAFQISILIFKSWKMRRLSTRHLLREAIVSNFLNVYSLILIIMVTLGLALNVILHSVTIEDNSDRNETPSDMWKNVLLISLAETVVQVVPFYRNMALRYYLKQYRHSEMEKAYKIALAKLRD